MKKEKRRLVLSGTDDVYAKREAAQDPKLMEASAHKAAPLVASAPQRQNPKPVVTERTDGLPATPTSEAELKTQTPPPSIQMNYRLNLGLALSARLQQLADAHDQSIDLIMKGIRSKAAERFRALAIGAVKPPTSEPETGGKSIRYAATLAGERARNLNRWFDPFGLGVAKDACKPILIGLFQEEAKALCDAAETNAPHHR